MGNNGTSRPETYTPRLHWFTVIIIIELTIFHLSLLPSATLLNFLSSFPSLTLLIFLSFSSAQSLCLSDEPRAVKEYRYPEQLPGELYDADTQCKWQFGEKAKLCTLDFKKVDVTPAQTLMQNKHSEKLRVKWDEWDRGKTRGLRKKRK